MSTTAFLPPELFRTATFGTLAKALETLDGEYTYVTFEEKDGVAVGMALLSTDPDFTSDMLLILDALKGPEGDKIRELACDYVDAQAAKVQEDGHDAE